MAKKQNKTGIIGGKKPKSAGGLYKFIEDRNIEEFTKSRKKYGDRGQAGKDMIDADYKRRKKAKARDEELIYQYGRDAPKARTFGTKYPAPKKKPKPKAVSTRAGHSPAKTTKEYATTRDTTRKGILKPPTP